MKRAMEMACTARFPSLAVFLLGWAVVDIASAAQSGELGAGSGGGRPATTDIGSVALWSAALIGAMVLGGIILFAIRRRLLASEASAGAAPLTLHEVRLMRDRGELSEEEFEAAKAAVLGNPLGVRRAKEGVDLTGEPLPKRAEPGPD